MWRGLSRSALARDPSFGANDLETLFFVSKSDDRSRVGYRGAAETLGWVPAHSAGARNVCAEESGERRET